MAVPHVAGVAALYLAENPTATPAQVLSDRDIRYMMLMSCTMSFVSLLLSEALGHCCTLHHHLQSQTPDA